MNFLNILMYLIQKLSLWSFSYNNFYTKDIIVLQNYFQKYKIVNTYHISDNIYFTNYKFLKDYINY